MILKLKGIFMKTHHLIAIFFLASSYSAFAGKSKKDRLQGKWRSDTDKEVTLSFEGKLRKEKYGKEDWDPEEFILSERCENPTDKIRVQPKVVEGYISQIKSDMCWAIDSVTESSLVLTYVARGNSLSFKRIKD